MQCRIEMTEKSLDKNETQCAYTADVEIDQITFLKEFYPRDEINNAVVNAYADAVDHLPPIRLSKDNVLIDGYHRLIAYRIKGKDKIRAIYEDVPASEILWKAVELNSKHGLQLTRSEKRRIANSFYPEHTQKEIAKLLSVSRSTITNWLSDKVRALKEEREAEILKLFLACYKQQEIAEKLDLTQSRVSQIIKKVKNDISNDLPKPENLKYFNHWSFSRLGEQLEYPGRTPVQLIENLLYYYTEPFEIVIDPMAGSGVTIQACKNMKRRYLAYDIRPTIPGEIKQNDILNGIPAKGNFIFLDPPYATLPYSRASYPQNMFTDSIESFYKAMDIVFKVCKDSLMEDGKIALLLKPYSEGMRGKWHDLTHECINIAKHHNYELIYRISTPLPTSQFSDPVMAKAKEKRVMLSIHRDLSVFRMKQIPR